MQRLISRAAICTIWLASSAVMAQAAPPSGAVAAPAPTTPPEAQPTAPTAPSTAAPASPQPETPLAPAVAPSTTGEAAAPAPTPAAEAASPGDNGSPQAPVLAPAPAPAAAPAATQSPAPAMQPLRPPLPMRAPPAEPANAEEPDRTASKLYMRFGAGFGFPFGPDIAYSYDDRGRDALHFSGYSFSLDVMAGAAVLKGLVVGGGAASDTVAGGTVRNGNEDKRGLEHSLYYAVIGGFADFYTAPPAGLHFQVLLGLARLSPSADLGHNTAVGFGTVLGVGYELPVGRRWNLGALARLAFSPLGMNRVAGQQPSPTFYEPSLLWTATFRPQW